MKHLTALSAAGLMFAAAAVAQSPHTQFEQYHKAKYGGYSPREEARQMADRAKTVVREEVTTKATERTEWVTQYCEAKFGRRPPMDEARQQAGKANTAVHGKDATEAAPRTDWVELHYRAKFGRSFMP